MCDSGGAGDGNIAPDGVIAVGFADRDALDGVVRHHRDHLLLGHGLIGALRGSGERIGPGQGLDVR